MQIIDHKASKEEIRKILIRLVHRAFYECVNEKRDIRRIDTKPAKSHDYISLQYYYDEFYNRTFIEFDLSKSIRKKYNLEKVKKSIIDTINSDFHRITGCYPEIIAYDDGKNERYDSIDKLSPYTIGYWKCLHGKYEFIYSHQVFMGNMTGINIPTYPDDFIKETENCYNDYYNSKIDYREFIEKIHNIRNKYKISSDKAPDKKIEDFISSVEILRKKYNKNILSEIDKTNYIKEFMQNPKDVANLNKKYGIKETDNSLIPKMFAEYKVLYKNFFGVELRDINSNAEVLYIVEENDKSLSPTS